MKRKNTWLDKIRAAFKANDEEKLEAALKEKEKAEDDGEEVSTAAPEGEGEHTHIHLHGAVEKARTMDDEEIEKRFKSLEDGHKAIMDGYTAMKDAIEEVKKMVAAEKPEGDEDPIERAVRQDEEGNMESMGEVEPGMSDKAAKDSKRLPLSFQEVISMAEVLAPGIQLPTFDGAAKVKNVIDSMCKLRRQALDAAYKTESGKEIIEAIHGKALALDGMKCGDVAKLFRAAAVAQKTSATRALARDWQNVTAAGQRVSGGPKNVVELNKMYSDFYSKQ